MKLGRKTIIIIAVGIVVAIVLFIVIRKIVKNNTNRERIRNNAQTIVELEQNGAKPEQLSESQQSHIADVVHDAVDGVGTKESQLVNALESIPTAADYFAVKRAYDKAYGADMFQDIADDVEPRGSWLDVVFDAGGDDDDRIIWGRINSHLNLISVPENLR